jgi:pSer/pThr/pTyr-binding forkhead associated (FHA) protein
VQLPPRIAVQLLDSSHGSVVHVWRFDAQERITIGRGEEQDVCVGDQYVSRLHAELAYADSKWMVIARGRNGVFVDGELRERFEIDERTTFRLGPAGPALSIRSGRLIPEVLATMNEEPPAKPQVRINEEQKAREIEEIIAGDYFQQLARKAREMRAHA